MNSNILKITAIALMLAVTTTGCDKNEKSKTDNGVDSEINIRMIEVFDNSPRTLQMYFATTKIYPCMNYPIDLSWNKTSNSIGFSIKRVIETNLCLTAVGPATATIDLGTLSSGTYQINLQNRGVMYAGELVVSSDNYSVNFIDNSAFNFSNSPLNKIPENTIWGLINYYGANYIEEEILPQVQSFFETLIELGAEKRVYNPGYYSAFFIDEEGSIADPPDITAYIYAQPFIFYYSGSMADLEPLVKQYKEQLHIRIYSDKGEQLLSWDI